ncbi:hypothetical protein HDV62DRAFT_385858 [Trichoderma sp. SZMC 28011]
MAEQIRMNRLGGGRIPSLQLLHPVPDSDAATPSDLERGDSPSSSTAAIATAAAATTTTTTTTTTTVAVADAIKH